MSTPSLKEQFREVLPRTVRPHRILSGRLRGYRIVTSWHDYPGAILGRTERHLLDWFEEHVHEHETWLDVGAHYGYTAIGLSRLVGPRGRVFAFEPEVATAGYLMHTRTLNRLGQLSVVPLGLGDCDPLEMSRLPVVRGMIDRTITADGKVLSGFLVARLDWLWDRICADDRAVDGVKIDVQGMEIEAISGMSGLLREFGPKLVLELHCGVDRGKLLDLLESVGYSRLGEPIDRDAGGQLYLDDRSYCFHAHLRVGSKPPSRLPRL